MSGQVHELYIGPSEAWGNKKVFLVWKVVFSISRFVM